MLSGFGLLQCRRSRLQPSRRGPVERSKALLVFSILGSFLRSGSRPAPEGQKIPPARGWRCSPTANLAGAGGLSSGGHLPLCHSARFSFPITATSCGSSSPPHAIKPPPGMSFAVVSIDRLEIRFSDGGRAGEKGFPAPSIAPADPSAPGSLSREKTTCSSSPRAFSLSFVQKQGLFF